MWILVCYLGAVVYLALAILGWYAGKPDDSAFIIALLFYLIGEVLELRAKFEKEK
jgi:hypothetical protein